MIQTIQMIQIHCNCYCNCNCYIGKFCTDKSVRKFDASRVNAPRYEKLILKIIFGIIYYKIKNEMKSSFENEK